MDAADVEHKLAVHIDPHVIVAAVLECDRLGDVFAVIHRIDKLGFHRHAEVVVVTVSVIIRVSFRFVIGVEREETDLEARIHLIGINDRFFFAVQFDIIFITDIVVCIVDDVKGLIVNIKFPGVGIKVGVVIIAVVVEMAGIPVSLQQMIDVCVDRLVCAHIHAAHICTRFKQISETVAGTRNMRVAV